MNKKMTLFSLTWPIFIELFLHMLMGNVDTFMLSQYSDEAVAAVSVSNQVLNMLIVMFGFVSTATAILNAQYLGAKNKEKVQEVSSVSLGLNFIFGLILSFFFIIFAPYILRLMKIPDELIKDAMNYLQLVGGFLTIQALIMTISAILRSHGFMKDSLRVTFAMNLMNIVGNSIFIFGLFGVPKLGVVGVAISTVASKCIGLIILGWILWIRTHKGISFKYFKPFPKNTIIDLIKIGVPSAGENMAYNTSQLVITSFIAGIGITALTTKGYVQAISPFIFLFALAIAQGTQILVGHLVGANKMEEAYTKCLKSLKIALIISFFAAIFFAIFSEKVLGIFTQNPSVISTGSLILWFCIILEPGRTFNLVIINSLKATGDVNFPVLMGILSMWGISVPLCYILGIYFKLGLLGIWIGFAADEWFRGIIMYLRWRSRVWQKMSFVLEKIEEAEVSA